MIAALISIAFVAASVQFVYYCRSALASAREVDPSNHAFRVAGLESGPLNACDFQRFFGLAHLCPEHGRDAAQLRCVATYYRLLRVVADVSHHGGMEGVCSWARREQRGCAHFAAIVLDRRISSSRELLAQRGIERF